MQRRIGLVAAIVATAALASPATSGAAKGDGGAATAEILVNLAHPKGLNRFAREVSTPGSRRYRDYRSPGALIQRFGASKSTQKRALAWLDEHGLEGRVGRTDAWILADADERALPNSLFSPRQEHRARSGGAVDGRVPAALRGVVTGVSKLSDARVEPRPAPTPSTLQRAVPLLPPVPPSSQRPHTGTAAGCSDGVNAGTPPDYLGFTPNQYVTAYGMSDLHAKGITGAGQRVALVEVDDFHRPDIKEWTECFGIDLPPIKHHWVGPKVPTDVLGESNLDLEVLAAAAPGLESIDVYQAPATVKSFGESLLLAVPKAFGGRKNTADVISMSLGTCEGAQSQSLVFNRAITHAFQIAAGAGISVLVASQDTGSTTCRTGGPPGALPLLSPSFPGTNPFVTSVGGTNFELDADNRITEQVTWNDKPNALAGSGGGTSGFYRRPWYQRGVVGTGSDAGKGRAVPDIAGLADITPGYSILCSPSTCLAQGWRAIGGTSAATPLFAGGVALANQAAAEQGASDGGSNLGFLNPLLYSVGGGPDPASLFDDITVGGNDVAVLIPPAAGGSGPVGCCKARQGFDRATGWGAPDIDALAHIGPTPLG